MAAKKFKKRRRIKIKVPESCYFCDKRSDPDYKKREHLAKFLSDRAKIMGRDRTGICSKHQRRLSREILRARHLGLLPFVQSI